MDGLERVLVAYHRFNAHQIRDDEVEGAEDQIAKRDPCAAIDTEDDELLRKLADASPSKLVVTSRLMPRTLLNKSLQPLPGVRREHLTACARRMRKKCSGHAASPATPRA